MGELERLVADLPHERSPRGRVSRLWWLRPVPIVPILLVIALISLSGWHHHGPWGLLWLIPVLFLIRVCVWRRVRRWDPWRNYRAL